MARFLGSHSSAKYWNECYPLGNGRIGVMDNGNPNKDIICLNDDTFWSGNGIVKSPAYVKDIISEVRDLMKEKKIAQAQRLVEDEINGENTQSYILLGKLLTDKGRGRVKDYYRTLDFASGLQTITYQKGNKEFEEKSFVSFPNQVYVRKITCSKPTNISISFDSLVKHTVRFEDDMIIAEGFAPSTIEHPSVGSKNPVKYMPNSLGMGFTAICKVVTDGEILEKKGSIFVKGYTNVEFYYTSKTSFEFLGDRCKFCKDVINTAIDFGFEQCKNVSSADIARLFNRVELVINNVKDSPEDTLQALKNIKSGADPLPIILTLYDFGRYLMISGSREDSHPLTLQGIWSDSLTPPWASNYTLNINFQMNYWAALSSNLHECYLPYIEQIKKIAKNGETLAKSFGARGWVCGHNSDIFGHCQPVDKGKKGSIQYSLCMGASGWLALSLYKKYQYRNDTKYLKEIYDVIKGAVEFYIDFITFDEETNKYVCFPDISPENMYLFNKKKLALDKAPAMTMCIIRELFAAYVDICKVLEIEDSFTKEVARHMHFITPYIIGGDGRIQEWSQNFKEVEPKHRHLSHLYGLYPGEEIAKSKGAFLKEAAEKSLESRGDEGTGWSLAWKACLWSRLKNGNRAYEILKKCVRYKNNNSKVRSGGVYSSLLSAHPPFQIDGNLGFVAAINEMLVQSYQGIELLPALPDEWYEGEIKGLTVQGGQSISFYWQSGRVIRHTQTKLERVKRYSDIDFL